MNTKELDKKYIMNTYGRYDVALKKGKGSYAYDENGKKYLDVSSGIGVNCLGYCDRGWVEAVTEQLSQIQHMSNYFYSPQASLLAQRLCSLTPFSKVWFGNSGAEANECAVKLARKYSFDKYGEGRNEIITLKNSFHGRTVTTLTATGQEVFHNYFFPFTPGFKYVLPNDIEDMKSLINSRTCAVMIECVQGEGGVNILDKDYVRKLRQLCDEGDIVLIADEVQTGVGRTGKLFCYENFDIAPDVITCAKGLGGGLPIGACLCNEKLKGVLTPSTHGSTFGANPAVCAGANYVLSRVADKDFLRQVAEKGDYLVSKLKNLRGVKSVRGLGLMIGIEPQRGDVHRLAEKCVKNGLLIITAKNLLRMLPPLTITYQELDEAVQILEKTITED